MRTGNTLAIVLAIGMVLTVTGSARAGLQDGLISYWSFDETSGTTVADGFGANDGTASGGYDLNVSGKIGSGIDFSGGQVLVGSVGISGNADRTIAGWFHSDLTDPPGDWRGIYGFYKTTGGNGEFFGVDVINNDDVGIHIYGFEEPFADLEISSWHYVVATYDSSVNRIYTSYDGAALVERTPSQTVNTNDLFMMGFRPDQNNDFDGQVDEVAVWDRALNGAEVTELWNGGAGNYFLDDGTLTSTAAGRWNVAGTWTGDVPGGVPTGGSIVNVDGETVDVDMVGSALDLTLSAGILNVNAALTVNRVAILSGGAMNIASGVTFTAGSSNTAGMTFADATAKLSVGNLTIDSAVDIGNLTTVPGTLSIVTGGAFTIPTALATANLTIDGGVLNRTGAGANRNVTVDRLTLAGVSASMTFDETASEVLAVGESLTMSGGATLTLTNQSGTFAINPGGSGTALSLTGAGTKFESDNTIRVWRNDWADTEVLDGAELKITAGQFEFDRYSHLIVGEQGLVTAPVIRGHDDPNGRGNKLILDHGQVSGGLGIGTSVWLAAVDVGTGNTTDFTNPIGQKLRIKDLNIGAPDGSTTGHVTILDDNDITNYNDDVAAKLEKIRIRPGSSLTIEGGAGTLDVANNELWLGPGATLNGIITGAGGGAVNIFIGDDGHNSVDGTVEGSGLSNVNDIIINRGAYGFGTANAGNNYLGTIDGIAGRIRFDGDERYENALIGNGELKIDIDDVNAKTVAWDGDNEGGGGFAAKGGTLSVELNPSIGGPATIYMGNHENDGTNPGIEHERELSFGAEDADNVVTLLNPLNGNSGGREINVFGNPGVDTDGVKLRVAQLTNFGQITVRGDGEGKMILDVEAAAAQLTNNNNLLLQGVGELHIVSTGGPGSLQMGSDTGYDWILVESMESNRHAPGHIGDKLVLDGSVDLSGARVRIGWYNDFNASLVSTSLTGETIRQMEVMNDDSAGSMSTVTFAGDLNLTENGTALLIRGRDGGPGFTSTVTVDGSLNALQGSADVYVGETNNYGGQLLVRDDVTVGEWVQVDTDDNTNSIGKMVVGTDGTGNLVAGRLETYGAGAGNAAELIVNGNATVNEQVSFYGNSLVNVTGTLQSTLNRVYTDGTTNLTVGGDVLTLPGGGDEVRFAHDSNIDIGGSINSAAHVESNNNAVINVVGSVTARNAFNAYDNSTWTIGGDLTSDTNRIYVSGTSSLTVAGDVTTVEGDDDGDQVEIVDDGLLSVGGNIVAQRVSMYANAGQTPILRMVGGGTITTYNTGNEIRIDGADGDATALPVFGDLSLSFADAIITLNASKNVQVWAGTMNIGSPGDGGAILPIDGQIIFTENDRDLDIGQENNSSGTLNIYNAGDPDNAIVNANNVRVRGDDDYGTGMQTVFTYPGNFAIKGNFDVDQNSRAIINGNLSTTHGRIWVAGDSRLEVFGDITTGNPDGDQAEFVGNGQLWVHGNINAGRVYSAWSNAGDTPSLRMVGGGTITTWRDNQDNYYQGNGHPIIGDLSYSNDDAITSYIANEHVQLRRGTMNIGSPTKYGVITLNRGDGQLNVGQTSGPAHLNVWGEPGTTVVSSGRLFVEGQNDANHSTADIIGNVELRQQFEVRRYSDVKVTGNVTAERFYFENDGSNTLIVGDAASTRNDPGFEFRNGGVLAVTGTITEKHRFELGNNSGGKLIANNIVMTNTGQDFEWERGILAPGASAAGEIAGTLTITGASNSRQVNLWNQAVYEWNLGGAEGAASDRIDLVNLKLRLNNWVLRPGDVDPDAYINSGTQVNLFTYDTDGEDKNMPTLDWSLINADPDTALRWDTSGVTVSHDAGGKRVYLTGLVVEPENFSDVYTWDGEGGDVYWATLANWDLLDANPATPPTIFDKAIVNTGGIAEVDTDETVHSLDINGGAVTVNSGSTLSVTNNLDLAGGSLTVATGATIDQLNKLTMSSGLLDVTGTINAQIVSLNDTVNLNNGAVFNATTVGIDGGTTTVANGVTVNGDFQLNAAGTLAITGNVDLANLTSNGGTFALGGNTLTVGTYRQNSGTASLAVGDALVAETYALNGGNIGFAMTDASGASKVEAIGNTTTLDTGFAHTYTGKTEVKGGATLTLADEFSVIDATDYLIVSGTMNMNGNVTTTHGAGPVSEIAPGALSQSIFEGTPDSGAPMDMEGASYTHAAGRTMTGVKAGTILTLIDTHSGLATSEIQNWNTFPTYGGGDHMVTAFSGVFIPSENGSYNFRGDSDDWSQMWIDMDDSGVFDAGENVGPYAWHSSGNKDLVAGTSYDIIIMSQENAGGESVNWFVTKPSGGEDRINPADPAGNGGAWGALQEWTGTTKITSGGVLKIGNGAVLDTANVAIDAGGAINVNDGLIAAADVDVSGTLTLADGDAVSDAGLAREVPLTANAGGMIDISKTGGLNRSSRMLIETYGILKGDLTSLAYSDTPGSGLVTFENRAVLAPTSATGTFPTDGDLGGNKLLYGVLDGTDSVQAGANVEAVGGSTIFAGAYFGPGSYAGGDYSAALTNEAGSGDLQVVVNSQELKLNGATLASDSGTTRFEVMTGGRVTVTGGGFNGNNDIVVTGKYDPVDGSGMNTTGQAIFRVQGNDILQDGQNIRVDKGVFQTYQTDWPVTGGATATVTIGPLGAMSVMDWGDHDWISKNVRRGTYVFEPGAVLEINWDGRLRQDEAMWDIDPDAYFYIENNMDIANIDPRVPGGAQEELDNVNWIIGADQLWNVPMGAGRRLTVGWGQGQGTHDNNCTIVKSVSSDPTGSFVIISSSGGQWNTNGAGGELDMNSRIFLPGVDLMINDALGSSITLPMTETNMTRRTVVSDGRVNLDSSELQVDDLVMRNGYVRFGGDRDMKPVITGDIIVYGNTEVEFRADRDEGNGSLPATDTTKLRYQVENDTLAPIILEKGAYMSFYYRGMETASAADQDEWRQGHTLATPFEIKQTITVLGGAPRAGIHRTFSGDAMTRIRFDEEGGDGDGNNHVLFPNIILEDGAHLGIHRDSVDREELRLGVTLKGDAKMERESEEWSFEDVRVETPGQEFTLTVDRDGNGGQYDMYGTVGAGVTLMGVDVHFDFNWGANMEDGAVVANLGRETPGEPNSDGYIRVFTGSDGNNPITGGTFLIGGDQDMEIIVDDHADTQIVNNFGGTIEFVDNGAGARAGYVRSRRRHEDLAVAGKVVYADIVIDGAATASIYHDHDTDYNMLRVDTGTGGGNLNAEWGGHDFNLNELTGAGRLHNGIFHVDTTLAPGAGVGTLTVQNLVVEGAANYEMQFDVAVTDKVHVDDVLTINDGWTLELLSDGGFADPAVEYDIFTWGNSATVSNDGAAVLAGTYTIDNSAVPDWDITSAVLKYDAGGKRIYLTGVDGLDDLSWNANDGNWNDGTKWSTGNPPVANSVPLVDRSGRIATVANGGQIAFRLTVEAGRVDIDGGDLSITTDVNVNGAEAELSVTDGALNVAGDLNVGGAGGAVTVTANVGLARQGVANVDNSVNVVANGNLTVSDGGELNTPTLNIAGMTNLIGATGEIGTINITNGTTTMASTSIPRVNATGGVLNTEGDGVENLTVGGTAKVNTTAATAVTDLQMSSGRVLLTGGGLTVTTANLAGGVMDASDNALVVSQEVALSDLNIATSGAEFTLSGADLVNHGVARTLTLQGGVITAGSGAMPTGLKFWLDASDATTLYQDVGGTTPAADGTPVALWKDRSGNGYDVSQGDAGLQAEYDVSTNPLNGQATVYFEDDVLGRANDIGITGNADRTVITVWHNATGTGQNYQHTFHHGNGGTTGESYGHSVSRGGNAGEIGNHYWGEGFNSTATTGLTQANIAISTWDGDGAGADGLDSWYVNGAAAGTYTRAALNTGANDLLLGSRLTPQAEGIQGNIAEVLVFDRILTADEINNMGGYLRSKWGIAAPAWTGDLRFNPAILSTTSIVATENSTLAVTSEPGDPLTLAGIEVAGGKTLTIDSPATTINLTNLKMGSVGSGSTVKSPLTAPGTGTAAVTITLEGEGTLNAGNGNSMLGVFGDSFPTNLTLADTTIYEWSFTKDDGLDELWTGDALALFGGGAVVIGDGFTIKLIDGGGSSAGAAGGVDVALFGAPGGAAFDASTFTVLAPAGKDWKWDTVGGVPGAAPIVEFDGQWVVLRNLVTAAHPGDANKDSKVDWEDLVLFNAQFGLRGPGQDCDFDLDNDVDLDDLKILKDEWGWAASAPEPGGAPDPAETPEPATMTLLALGGLLVLRRRRRKA